MAISFEDSLKNSLTKKIATTSESVETMAVMSADIPSIMTLDENPMVAAYSGSDGNWQQHSGYVYYSVFSDDNISTVNDVTFPSYVIDVTPGK